MEIFKTGVQMFQSLLTGLRRPRVGRYVGLRPNRLRFVFASWDPSGPLVAGARAWQRTPS